MSREIKIFILAKGNKIIGAWSSLKHLCDDLREKTIFPSYNTISRMKKDKGELNIKTKEGVEYLIKIEILKQFNRTQKK